MEIFTRVQKCLIGKDEDNIYTWYGIKKLSFEDVDPWVHIDIPAGLMIHQHLRSVHYTGEIIVNDLETLYTALFETYIDSSNRTAVSVSTGKKYNVEYIAFDIVDINKEVHKILFDGFKVKTVTCLGVELGTETQWIVRFIADRISYS